MRAVYLVRHGQPEKPDVSHLCVGRFDLPLSQEGKQQAKALGDHFRPLLCAGESVKVVSSPLARCRDTAAEINPGYIVMEDFLEVDMGQWTGRSFDDIKRIWPDIYEIRGKDMINIAPPGGESLIQCRTRALEGLKKALSDFPGSDLIIVAHEGVIRMLVSGLSETGPEMSVPTGSIVRLLLNADPGQDLSQPSTEIFLEADVSSAKMPAELPPDIPDEKTCMELLEEAGTPPAAAAHCRTVADLALKICEVLERSGIYLNIPLVKAGALLHDIMKGRKHHASAGARWLFEKGYSSIAAVVGDHMFLTGGDEELINEKTVVFLADKLIKETSRVTLEERYLADPAPEKQPYAQARYEQAKRLLETFKRVYCHMEEL